MCSSVCLCVCLCASLFVFDEGGGEEYEAASHRSATDNKICEMCIHIRTNALYLYEYVSILKKICPTRIRVCVGALQIYVYATYLYATYLYATCYDHTCNLPTACTYVYICTLHMRTGKLVSGNLPNM